MFLIKVSEKLIILCSKNFDKNKSSGLKFTKVHHTIKNLFTKRTEIFFEIRQLIFCAFIHLHDENTIF